MQNMRKTISLYAGERKRRKQKNKNGQQQNSVTNNQYSDFGRCTCGVLCECVKRNDFLADFLLPPFCTLFIVIVKTKR